MKRNSWIVIGIVLVGMSLAALFAFFALPIPDREGERIYALTKIDDVGPGTAIFNASTDLALAHPDLAAALQDARDQGRITWSLDHPQRWPRLYDDWWQVVPKYRGVLRYEAALYSFDLCACPST